MFNTVRVETTKKRLENLGFFSKVDTYPEETGVEGRKDLVVQVEEKRTGSLNFGAGYSTIDSVIGFVELTQGNFDITNWPGLTGAGQKFRAKAQVGSQRQDFVVALTEPWFLDRPLSLGGQAFYSDASYLSSVYSQRNYGFSLELRKPLFSWVYGVLGYSLQNYEIYNVSSGVSDEILAEEGTRTKSMISTSLNWDRRDNPFLTRKGERISISPFVTGGPLGGNEQIYGFDVGATKYWRFWKDIIFLVDAEASTVDVWDSPETKTFTSPGTVVDAPHHRVTVRAVNAAGQTVTDFTGTLSLTSSDGIIDTPVPFLAKNKGSAIVGLRFPARVKQSVSLLLDVGELRVAEARERRAVEKRVDQVTVTLEQLMRVDCRCVASPFVLPAVREHAAARSKVTA